MSTNKQQSVVAGVLHSDKLDQLNQIIPTEGRDAFLDECYDYIKSMSNPKSSKK